MSIKEILTRILYHLGMIKDYVVEEAHGGITPSYWTNYRKWYSGRLELTAQYTGQPTTGGHYAIVVPDKLYGYYSNDYVFPDVAKPVNDRYMVKTQWKIGAGFGVDAGTAGAQFANKFNVYGIGTFANITEITVRIHVDGRWK